MAVLKMDKAATVPYKLQLRAIAREMERETEPYLELYRTEDSGKDPRAGQEKDSCRLRSIFLK